MLPALLALLVVQVLFAALPIASKFVLNQAHPFFVVVLRSAFGVLFFYLLTLFLPKAENSHDRLGRNTHFQLAGLAFFGITFNQVALFVALPHTSASIASIVSPSIAIFTLVFSVWLGREKLEPLSLFSVCLGALGVGLVLFSGSVGANAGQLEAGSGELWANGLNLVSAASYAFYLAKVGHLPSQLGTFRFMFFLFFYGFVMNVMCWLVLSALAYLGFVNIDKGILLYSSVADLGSSFWIGLLFLLIGATALTYVLNAWALQKVKPSMVGGFVCLQTVFGLWFSNVFLKESLTPLMIYGSNFILAGVLLLSISGHVTQKLRLRHSSEA